MLVICVVCCDVSICFYIYMCVCVFVYYVCQPAVEISRLQHLCRLLLDRKWIAVVGLSTSIKNNLPHETTFVVPVVPFYLSAFLEFRESALFSSRYISETKTM